MLDLFVLVKMQKSSFAQQCENEMHELDEAAPPAAFLSAVGEPLLMQGEVRRRRGRERVHPRLDPLSPTRSALFPDRFRDRPGDGGRCRGGAGGEPGPGISTPRALRPRSSPRGARPRVFGRRPGQDARAPAGEGGRRRRGGPRWDGGAIRARSLGSWKGALVHSSRASTRSTSPTRPQSWPARVRRRGSMGRESGLFSHLNDVESPPGTAHGPLRCV